ncbi:bacterial general secretion pathway protein f signature [Lucifera butyrica]|uniref:Bacterial general secretion pathway protein f signature n=1 Tax=Lucifera butyrica TaxID=1351585 RepID=A0A498R6Q1_9FIRM|nr:type II secretion system F family protein [Lucifera butyrica]VBB06879.1 bacterial general secretion pathway protein f signature [Lucifera butyrica]
MSKTFTYKAKDRLGQVFEGSILAESEAAVAIHIREKGYFITQIREQRRTASLLGRLEEWQGVKIKELAVFCRQFATMVDAGVPLITCLNILIEQAGSKRLKTVLQDVYKRVREGEALSRAMADYPRVFPEIMVNMIEAGEVGGVMDDMLTRLAAHFEKEYKLNEKVKSSLTYPAVVISMAVVVVIFILTFVLPTFMNMFKNMKVELPMPTRMLLAISGFLRQDWPLLIVLLLAGTIGLGFAYKQERVRFFIDSFLLRLPVYGVLLRKIAIARFSRTLSTLVRGGVSLITALEVVKRTTGNLNMITALTRAQKDVKEGLSLANTLAACQVFTPMVVQMTAIGEESGTLDTMLEKIADFYENEVDDMVGRLSSIMEPVIVGILGVVIGFIVISIMLPLFDVITNVNAFK